MLSVKKCYASSRDLNTGIVLYSVALKSGPVWILNGPKGWFANGPDFERDLNSRGPIMYFQKAPS